MAQPPRAKLSSGPAKHVYDVIVIGGQLGGALAGALLAKRGHRVLLVEHDGVGPGYEHEGFVLPYAPSIVPPLKTMPGAEDALTELGLTTAVSRSIRLHVPGLQLILPRHRIDLAADEKARLAELRREFGQTGEEVARALTQAASAHEATDAFFKSADDLPPTGFFEGLAVKKRIREVPALSAGPLLPGDDPASHLLRGLTRFVTFSEAPSGVALTRPLSQVLKGPGRYPNGVEGLREQLLKRIDELGGDVLAYSGPASVVEQFELDGSEAVGIKLMGSENVYRASCFVAATDAGALRRLLAEKRRNRGLIEQLDLSNVKRFGFTVNWVLPEEVLPRGLGELALMDGGELGPILLQVSAARKVGAKTDEERLRVVSAGAAVPASAREMGEAHLTDLARRLDSRLDELLPFAKGAAVLLSTPQLNAGGVRGSRLLPHPLYGLEGESLLGVTGLQPRTEVKNFYLAGREVLPGLGLEGEFLAGMRAARLVQESLGKKNPLKR
jgi:phytoene dehydrogenase-like protein